MSFAAAKKFRCFGRDFNNFVFLFVFLAPISKKKENFLDVCYFNNNAAPRQHKNRRARILLHIRIKNFIGFSGDFAVFLLAGTEQILLGFITRAIKRNQSEIEIEEYF